MKRLPALLLFLSGFSFVVSAQSSWKPEFYNQYDHESFKVFAPANQRIDFKNIDYALLNAAIFYETNRQRVLNGVAPGSYAVALEKIAFEHSVDMVNLNSFSHTSQIPEKADMSDRLTSVGIVNSAAAENIAITFGIEYEAGRSVYSPSTNGSAYFSYEYKGAPILNCTYNSLAVAALVQWMNSPGHRANILNGYAYMGCGGFLVPIASINDFPSFKLTQNFARIAGNSDVSIDYGAYTPVAMAPVQEKHQAYNASSPANDTEETVPAARRKPKKTGPARLTVLLGAGGTAFLGPRGDIALRDIRTGYEFDGHLGLRFGRLKHSVGVFGRYGSLSGFSAQKLADTYVIPVEGTIAEEVRNNSFTEIEGGFIFWRLLRLSGGSSISQVKLEDGTSEELRLGTATFGLQFRFGPVRWFINGTTYFDTRFQSFYLRPSSGLGLQFNMIKFK